MIQTLLQTVSSLFRMHFIYSYFYQYNQNRSRKIRHILMFRTIKLPLPDNKLHKSEKDDFPSHESSQFINFHFFVCYADFRSKGVCNHLNHEGGECPLPPGGFFYLFSKWHMPETSRLSPTFCVADAPTPKLSFNPSGGPIKSI